MAPKKNAPGGKMVTMTTFQTQLQALRSEIKTDISNIQEKQTQMMDKFKRDLKVIQICREAILFSSQNLTMPLGHHK